MKIYYFTGTGNSQMLAEELAARLPGCAAVPMTREGADIAGCTGFVFPVYFAGLPNFVRAFLEASRFAPDAWCFGIANNGGMAGAALGVTDRLLRARGARLDAGFAIKMPDNFIPLFTPPDAAGQQKLFAAARKRLDEVAEAVQARRVTRVRRPNVLTERYYEHFRMRIPAYGRKFRVTDACVGCGRCAAVCPVGNVALRDGKPVWGEACEACFACLQYCPTEAVQCGKGSEKRARYRNPFVKR